MGTDLSPASQKATVQSFLKLMVEALFREKKILWVLFLSLLALALSQSLLLFLFKGFMVVLFEPASTDSIPLVKLLPKELARWVPDQDAILSRQSAIIMVPTVILVAGLIKALSTYFYQSRQQVLVLAAARFLRVRIFDGILDHSYLKIMEKTAAQWMSIVMNDVLLLQIRFAGCLTSFVKDSVLILACFVVLVVLHWPSALILVLLAPLVMFGMGWGARRIAYFAELWQIELAKLSGKILDIRKRFDFMRSQGGESLEQGYFEQINDDYYQMIRKSLVLRSAFAPAMEFLGIAIFCVFVVLIQAGYFGQGMQGEILLQFFLALGLVLKPMRNFGEQLTKLSETRGFLAQALEVLPTGHSNQEKNSMFEEVHLPVSIDRVQVAYGDTLASDADKIKLEPGKTIAVVGPSGSGKTTVLKSLAGLIEPKVWQATSGWESVAESSALVPQQPFLFSDSLRANLKYGTPEISDTQIMEVLGKVNLTHLGDQPIDLNSSFAALNQNLSGGQVQRMVIARGMLRQKRILLLDEATSALDGENESKVLSEVISVVKKNDQVLLAVTHRLRCLPLFDEIWFFAGGKLVAKGRHEELLLRNDYQQFCQLGGQP